MRKHWLTAMMMAVLLLLQTVTMCGGALAEGEEHVHTPSGWKHDEFTHWRDCTECGKTLLSEVGEHVLEANDRGTYSCVCGYEEDHLYDPDTTQWVCDEMTVTEYDYQPCKVCGSHHGKIEEHDYPESPDSDGNYVCAKCGYKRSHIEHKWSNEWTAVPNEHFHVCEYEGCNVHDNETAAAHTWQETENGTYICTTCGYEIDHEHEADTDWTYNADNHWHACTHEGCEWNADFNVHTIVKGKCKDCGYEKHEHEWGPWYHSGNEHFRYCKKLCGASQWEEHTIIDAGNNIYKCTTCGYERNHKDHDWDEEKWEYNAGSHWHGCKIDQCVSTKDGAPHTFVSDEKYGWVCEVCGYIKDETEHEHVWSKEWGYDEEYHYHKCEIEGCEAKEDWEQHNWVDNGSFEICDKCGWHKCVASEEMLHNDQYHWYKCAYPDCDWVVGYEKHQMVEDTEKGGYVCTVCGYERDHEHAWDGKLYYDAEKHYLDKCTICGIYRWDEAHSMFTNVMGISVCEHCGYHIHDWSADWDKDETQHWHECRFDGNMDKEAPEQIATFAIADDKTESHLHESCKEKGAVAAHNFVNGVCECGYEEPHQHSWSDWENVGTGHKHHCTAEGCDAEEQFDHELVDGRCDKCGYTMHGAKNEWKYDENKHWHECLFEGCTEMLDKAEHDWTDWEGVATGHKRECKVCHYVESVDHGEDVYNAGKCDICGFTMHGAQDEWKYDENTHWHECKFDGCTEKFDEKDHVIIGGKCKCGYEKKHDYSDEWSYDEVDHWHACTEEGCNWTKDQAEHDWTDWEGVATSHKRECKVCHYVESVDHGEDVYNAGKCEICGFTMHGAQDEWKNDEHTHWHGCKFDGCEEKYDEAEHTWGEWIAEGTFHERECTVCHRVQHENHDLTDGKCEICGFTMHGAQDEWKYDEHTHWHECKFDGCEEKYDEAEHTWGEWIAEGTFHERECTVCHRVQHENHDLTDGKCDICGFTMHGAQDEWKNDEHTHWHGCKFDGCKDKFDENEHDFVNGVCSVCGYRKIEDSVYDDVQPVIPAPLPPQTGDASYLAIGIGMIAAALCIALRKRQSN